MNFIFIHEVCSHRAVGVGVGVGVAEGIKGSNVRREMNMKKIVKRKLSKHKNFNKNL